jgi:hypothetical protein
MRSLALVTAAAVVLFGCGSSVAQVGSTSTANAPGMRATSPGMSTMSTTAVPGTIPTGTALGAMNTGTLGQISGTALGTIVTCPTMGATALSAIFNASRADPIYGTLPAQPLPGATVPAAPPFGSSTLTGGCDPNASTLAIIEALGGSVAVTIPGPAITTASTYSDATIPATATEASGAGLSPLIIVPAAGIVSSAPGAMITATMPTIPTTSFTTSPPATTFTTLSTFTTNTLTSGSLYSGATIPPAATEAGGTGLSPLMIVPAPVDPSASP